MTRAAPVGILMLDSRFPRIPGDVGNPLSWSFPILKKTVRQASPERVVRRDPSALLPDFVAAGQELVREGAVCITTSCGFLAPFQEQLAAALPVPVLTSSLFQVETVNRLLPAGRRAGVLTISGSSLTDKHLAAAGVPEGTPVASTETGREFTQAILGDRSDLDVARAQADNVEAARQLCKDNPDVGAIVLECTNMGPYAPDIARATGRPVFSIITFVSWMRAGVVPPNWPD